MMSPLISVRFCLSVDWIDRLGRTNVLSMTKNLPVLYVPQPGDVITAAGCSPFYVGRLEVDLDDSTVEVWCECHRVPSKAEAEEIASLFSNRGWQIERDEWELPRCPGRAESSMAF